MTKVQRISAAERQALHESLGKARADIAAGTFDVVTSETLQVEFDAIFCANRTDEDVDAELRILKTSFDRYNT